METELSSIWYILLDTYFREVWRNISQGLLKADTVAWCVRLIYGEVTKIPEMFYLDGARTYVTTTRGEKQVQYGDIWEELWLAKKWHGKTPNKECLTITEIHGVRFALSYSLMLKWPTLPQGLQPTLSEIWSRSIIETICLLNIFSSSLSCYLKL